MRDVAADLERISEIVGQRPGERPLDAVRRLAAEVVRLRTEVRALRASG